MDASGTEALRGSATRWTLAGDKQLLQLLQDIHEKVVTKCKESNALLEQMTRSLDEASIDVQSVNNKFMSLSNSQFVESRVYGDDADVTKEPEPKKEEPKPPDSPLSRTKRSLQVLESMHDSYEIYDDTDSDSDSDNCISRTVLKPKDVYTHRPLPYIIGSYNWRTKWHVGLIHESSDSDEDSEVLYSERVQKPQYSDTESEREETKERSRTLSASSGSDRHPATAPPKLATVQSPADIASELARRLGNVGQMPSVSLDSEPPKMSTGKIYRPEQPTTATIFPDEPPPLDQTVSDVDYEEEEEDDIFAELHRNGQKEIARDEQRQSTSQPVSKQKTNLFEDDSESELFVPKPQIRIPVEQNKQDATDNTVKKPIGGISLFGNNKGADSIGAAILKRNQRKSSTSGDESDNNDVPKQKEETKTEAIKETSETRTKEKDIINNLFPKPQNKRKTKAETYKENTKPIVIKKEEKKVDLFSDNLFDDIDDIFSSNIVKSSPKSNAQKPKSLFDDDDDLFAEVSESKPVKVDSKDDGEVRKKGLFDSDDELFSETPARNSNKKILTKTTDAINSNYSKVKESKVKSIFDDSSDDDIFDKIVTTKPIRETTIISDHTLKPKDNEDNVIKSDKNFNVNDDNIFDDDNEQIKVITTDVDGDNANNNSNITSNGRLTPNLVTKVKKDSENNSKHVTFQSPSLFDDNDEIDDLDNLFSKDKQNIADNAGSSQQNIVSSLHENNTLLVEKEKNKVDLDSPIESSDVKSTNRVLAEETPYKKDEKDSKIIVDVDDSSLEDDFVQDFDDYYNNQPETLPEKRNENEINPVLVPEVPKYHESPNKYQFNEIPNKLDEKEQEKSKKDVDFIHETKSKESLSEKQQSTSNTFNKDVDQNIDFKGTIKTEELSTIFGSSKLNTKSNDFNKLFTEEPPAFEKPKESKKSKNVNALFDDDSDDEALFFKKSDAPLVDEKPELFPTTVDAKTNLFGIFLDEPPDLNVDFTQKDDEPRNKLENLPTDSIEDDSLFKPLQKLNEIEQKEENTKNIKATETKDSDIKKPIGKLKMNLNINVNTLLPGASPKKTIGKIEQIQPENSTNTSTEELDSKMKSDHKIDEKVQVITRSQSFEGDTEAKVLDNKLSKQRPRIQVKRRPSTRRARHEAVRKSIIDIGDDSTDNSSSIDDNSTPKPENISKDVLVTNESKEEDLIQNECIDTNNSKLDGHITKGNIPQFSDSNEYTPRKDVKSKVVYILNDEDIFTNTDVVKQVESKADDALNTSNKYDTASNVEKTFESKSFDSVDSKPFSDSKSNDKNENIFKDQAKDGLTTKLPDKTNKEQYKKPILNIVDDDDNDESLFKSRASSDSQRKPTVKQNETVQSETQKPKKSLFDDLSEDEDALFKPKTSKATKPKNIFGSDSDDDIFVSKKKNTKTEALKVEKREKVEVKKSLFSDDDDDDDLFGANKSYVDIKAPSKPTNSKESKKTKIALEDPLSMLDD